jgi:hypothetical protein
MDIPHTNIRWHFPVNQRWSLRFRGAIPGHGAHAAQVSRHGAQLPTLTWNFEAPYGGETGDMLRIGCGNPWNWMLMLFEPDLGRLWQESLQDRCPGRIQSTSPTSRNSKKDCLISPFIVIYRNLWGNPWTQLQCATTSDYCPRSAPGERGERGEANDLKSVSTLGPREIYQT